MMIGLNETVGNKCFVRASGNLWGDLDEQCNDLPTKDRKEGLSEEYTLFSRSCILPANAH